MAQNHIQNGVFLDFAESELTHPTHPDGLVDSGDPVYLGQLVGVAQQSAGASSDLITMHTQSVYKLRVVGADAGGNAVVNKGDRVYISNAGVINKNAGNLPFGIALGSVESGSSTAISVKVCGAAN